MLTNDELIESLIKDVNNLVKNMAAGQYVQFCLLVTQITQKLLNLKSGIKSDMDNKNSVIESLKETIRSFKEIIEGKHDAIPESYFLYAGSIDEVVEKWKGDHQ